MLVNIRTVSFLANSGSQICFKIHSGLKYINYQQCITSCKVQLQSLLLITYVIICIKVQKQPFGPTWTCSVYCK